MIGMVLVRRKDDEIIMMRIGRSALVFEVMTTMRVMADVRVGGRGRHEGQEGDDDAAATDEEATRETCGKRHLGPNQER